MYKFIIVLLLISGTASAQNNGSSFMTPSGTLNYSNVFTAEFWVRSSESGANSTYWQRPYLFGNETDGDNSGDFGIFTNNGYIGMWEGLSNLNTDQQFLSTSVRVNDNSWHHIAAVNNGQTLNLYVDGNIVGSLVSGRNLLTANAPLTFGAAAVNHSTNGSTGNTNFASRSVFGDARLSNIARYAANFAPPSSFNSDANTVALYHFGSQSTFGTNTNTNVAINMDPNRPLVLNSDQALNNNYAQPATLFINDSVVLYGKLFMAKKNWSFNTDVGIHFFENGSKKDKFYKTDEIKGFKMGDSYYEARSVAQGAVSMPYQKAMVKRLTPPDGKMAIYEYIAYTSEKNSNGSVNYKTTIVHLVQLPNDEKLYQFGDNKFVPHFDTRVSALVADKPALADKIRNKNKDYFYAFVTEATHQEKVWWNIVKEYNGQ